MAGTPDPLGGVGYANIFKGSPAVEDWREDLKWNRIQKAKVEDEKKRTTDKFLDKNIFGWSMTDQPELDLLYQSIQEKAMKDGVTPEVRQMMQKALGLAEASKEQEKYYNESLKYLQTNQKNIDPDEYAEAVNKLEAWRTQSGKAGAPGTVFARMQSEQPLLPEQQTDWLPASRSLVDKTKADIQALWKPGQSLTEEIKTYSQETIDANWDDYKTSDFYKAQAKQYSKESGEKDSGKIETVLKQRYIDKLPSYIKQNYKYPPEGRGAGFTTKGLKAKVADYITADSVGGTGTGKTKSIIFSAGSGFKPQQITFSTPIKVRDRDSEIEKLKARMGKDFENLTDEEVDELIKNLPQKDHVFIEMEPETIESTIPVRIWREPDGTLMFKGISKFPNADGTMKSTEYEGVIDENNKELIEFAFLDEKPIEEWIGEQEKSEMKATGSTRDATEKQPEVKLLADFPPNIQNGIKAFMQKNNLDEKTAIKLLKEAGKI